MQTERAGGRNSCIIFCRDLRGAQWWRLISALHSTSPVWALIFCSVPPSLPGSTVIMHGWRRRMILPCHPVNINKTALFGGHPLPFSLPTAGALANASPLQLNNGTGEEESTAANLACDEWGFESSKVESSASRWDWKNPILKHANEYSGWAERMCRLDLWMIPDTESSGVQPIRTTKRIMPGCVFNNILI